LILRDPVHGDVEFSESERMILDSREMQRLRGIKQLGTAYLVYPGALHTRFDHSIGTMAVAKRLLASLRSRGYEITAEEEEVVCIASLLHDITHVPFGHTFEDERKILPDHEKGDRFGLLLADGEASDALRDLGLYKDVLSILQTKEPVEKNHPRPWMAQVVKDSVSADLLDYLRRDSYFTGLAQDYDDRVFRYFILADLETAKGAKVLAVDLGKEGMVRQDARSEVLHLLRMRYFLTERVYYHHAKQASGAMISKGLEMCLERGLSPSSLLWMNDWTLLKALKEYDPTSTQVRGLIEGVERRRLYKRAFVMGPDIGASRRNELISLYNRPGPQREAMESAIISRLQEEGVRTSPGDLIIHCPDLGSMKEAGVFARDEEGMVERLNRHRRSLSRDLDPIENQYLAIWNFFVFSRAEIARKVNRVCRHLFDYEGAHFVPKEYG